MFLHHILNLDENDPVRHTYQQQLLYPAPNWANEVLQLKNTYNITKQDKEIVTLSKDKWKNIVNKKVREKALIDLNSEAANQKKAQGLCPYPDLIAQDYLTNLTPKQARKIFHVRTSCRLCQNGKETIEHILNDCVHIERTTKVQ
jgi:hypothetical protein